jgi:hypothetical protein
MKTIELRNVNHSPKLSGETNCFTADVFIDGALAGKAENRGCGGATLVNPITLRHDLERHAMTLPKRQFPAAFGGGWFQPSLDTLIEDAFQDWYLDRDLRKLLGNHIVALKGAAIVTARMKQGKPTEALKNGHVRAQFEADAFLNELPYPEALALYRQHAI